MTAPKKTQQQNGGLHKANYILVMLCCQIMFKSM